MTDAGQMDADLVGSAGFQLQLQMGIAGVAGQHRIVGDGRPAVVIGNGHTLAVGGMAADGGVDGAAVVAEIAAGNGLIGAAQGVILQLCGQGLMPR